MQPTRIASNPFALMMNPDAVLRAMASSDRLQRLQRRVYRPLDKPLIARVGREVGDFDQEADNADDTELE